ncbi:MAG: chemotaxis protein CheB [Pseudomonadota bacterium]
MDDTVVGSQLTAATHLVGIGASAGGVEALERFVESLPVDTGMAFVVVQHLAPDFESVMDQVLGRRTRMPIHSVRDALTIQANHLYVMPEGCELLTTRQTLQPVPISADAARQRPIDHFFVSLAEQWGEAAIAVVLSGTGDDGAEGARAVHDVGGLVIAQTSDSSGFDSMPNNTVATGVVDLVLAPEHIPPALVRIRDKQELPIPEPSDNPVYGGVFALLRRECGLDFNNYKIATVARRIERRMHEAHLTTMEEFVDFLSANPEELDQLYRDLLIGVTAFFRDSTAWSYLEEEIIPRLLTRAQAQGDLRIWTPGCATGEEVYSLAILVREAMEAQRIQLPVKIFATDVHKGSLEFAASGVYNENQVASLPQERLARHFARVTKGYLVKPDIRKMVVFARQDVTTDPPFTKLAMVVCRNMLIYLDAEAQRNALAMFHFALLKDSFLFLGPSESLGDLVNDFSTENNRFKVFTKRTERRIANASFRVPPVRRPPMDEHRAPMAPSFSRGAVGGRPASLIRAYDVLMEQYMPASVLVSGSGEIAHTFGDARRFLHSQTGVASLYLSELVIADLRLAVISALQKVHSTGEPLSLNGIKVTLDGELKRIDLRARPLPQQGRDTPAYILLSFEESARPEPSITPIQMDYSHSTDDQVLDLETELRYTREHLQTAVEDLETSNEELQATNEELMAANEELQSTNEELHSVNEELYTVNREHEGKINELTELTSDMHNLLKSTEIGTVFLDSELRIRKFTPTAAYQFNLLEQDIGRPIAHLEKHIEFEDFNEHLEQVLRDQQLFETEVRDRFGATLLLRMTPYRDAEEQVIGVVVTFVSVERVMSASRKLRASHEELQRFAYAVSHALQEPVRIVGTASGALQQSMGDRLLDHEGEMLRAAGEAADQAVQMIKGLLEFARVETRGTPPASASSAAACYEAIELLRPLIDADGAKIEIDELPEVYVDRSQLIRVFYHLLDNAVRYSARPARVQVSHERSNEMITLRIKDSGYGMSERELDRAFEVFGLIAPNAGEGPTGVGAGLPICKRIIERNGGHIWLESTVGKGTTVSFTLPRADLS